MISHNQGIENVRMWKGLVWKFNTFLLSLPLMFLSWERLKSTARNDLKGRVGLKVHQGNPTWLGFIFRCRGWMLGEGLACEGPDTWSISSLF